MSAEFQTDVPLPKVRVGRYAVDDRYARLAVGESFFAERPHDRTANQWIISCCQRARYRQLSLKYVFRCRTVTENGVPGVRVWRVA